MDPTAGTRRHPDEEGTQMTDPQTDPAGERASDQAPGGAWESLDNEARDLVLLLIEDDKSKDEDDWPVHDRAIAALTNGETTQAAGGVWESLGRMEQISVIDAAVNMRDALANAIDGLNTSNARKTRLNEPAF